MNFEVNVEYVYTDAANELMRNFPGQKMTWPGGVPLPMIGDDVGVMAAEWIIFRVVARQFLMLPDRPELRLILTIGRAP